MREDAGVLVVREGDLVKKTVRGYNHSGFCFSVPAQKMVDREIRALQLLSNVEGVPRFVRRTTGDTFFITYLEGTPLCAWNRRLGESYFYRMGLIAHGCEEKGVFRLGQNRRDFLVGPNEQPIILDFGNVLFSDDIQAKIPGLVLASRAYSTIRIMDLRRRYASSRLPTSMPI